MSSSSPPGARPPAPGRVLLIGLDGPVLGLLCALAEGPGPLPHVLERRCIGRRDVVAGHYPARLLGRPRLAHAFARLAGRHPHVLPESGSRPEDPLLEEALGRFRAGAPGPHVAEGLVARFDLVVQTLAPWHRYEWDPPLVPGTPALQLLLAEDGSLRCLGPGPWEERWCLSCLVRAAAGEPAADLPEVLGRIREALGASGAGASRPGTLGTPAETAPWARAGGCLCRLGARDGLGP
ncbi:hypothetical protein [Rothia halotolerans]|uniref:hypothetical protein n=1 Tax=Rothia halotolerans TaxID=405770 RepID=UPI00101C0973|nr:hypothetical protein [Rothia halotolerans]